MKDIFEGVGRPLTQDGFDATMDLIKGNGSKGDAAKGDPASLWSLLRVETRGFGFLPDRRPKILFERHIFRGRTGGRFDASQPDLSARTPGGYSGGAGEYTRLKRAMLLDRRAALESASWGLGQVMGFNATSIGYAGVEAMVAAFAEGEDAQMQGCARFITSRPALQKAYQARDWPRVAFFYNGESFRKNAYDTKLASAHDGFAAHGCPDVGIRAVQAYLAYLGFDPKGIDGAGGRGTTAALTAFHRAEAPARAAALKKAESSDAVPAPAGDARLFLGWLKDVFDQRAATGV